MQVIKDNLRRAQIGKSDQRQERLDFLFIQEQALVRSWRNYLTRMEYEKL